MDQSELRSRLGAILSEEERDVVNWTTVKRLIDDLYEDLEGSDCPHFVHHFLADSDIREKDLEYGDHQRVEVREFVETGEYVESEEGSCWWPLGVVAAVGAMAAWLFS